MFSSVKCLLVLTLISVNNGQDPRKRLVTPFIFDDDDDDQKEIGCSVKTCLKRSSSQDDFGPFWANRGKKDPTYLQEKLFAEEPHWILVRRDEPFLHSRGKKDYENLPASLKEYFKQLNGFHMRDRREYGQIDVESPFFASRGKKQYFKNMK